MDLLKVFAFARRIAEAIADGRVDASAIKDMSDEQLAEFDTEAYQALTEAQAKNEQIVASSSVPPAE